MQILGSTALYTPLTGRYKQGTAKQTIAPKPQTQMGGNWIICNFWREYGNML